MTNKIRHIAFLIQDFEPDDTLITMKNLANHFSESSRIFVILVSDLKRDGRLTADHLSGLGLDVEQISYNKRVGFKDLGRIRQVLKDRSVELIQTFSPESDLLAHFVLRGFKNVEWVSAVTDIHRSRELSPMGRFFYKRLLNQDRWTVFLSETEQNKMISRRGRKRSYVIPPSVADSEMEASHVLDSVLHFKWTGPLKDSTDIKSLLNAFTLFKANRSDVKLTIYGDGPLKHDLVSEVTEQKIVEYVEFFHFDQFEIQKGDVFICSESDPFSRQRLLEAMREGAVIIAATHDVLIEMLKDEVVACFYQRQDAFGLSLVMKELYSDRDRVQTLSQNSQNLFKNRYSLDHMLKEYEKLYRMI